VSDDNVFKLIQPGTLTDRLTEVLNDGARALLTQAVEAEVSEFLAATAELKRLWCKDQKPGIFRGRVTLGEADLHVERG
jgi:hypothetical protein